MSVSGNYDVLVIANPFLDRIRHIEHDSEFFKAHSLNKGELTATSDSSEADASWQASSKFAEEYIEALGGSGANVGKTLARLGTKVSICGKIGTDPIGENILQRLGSLGIGSLLSEGNKDTGKVSCYITPDKERTMHAYFGVADTLTKQDISENYFTGVKHVHLEGYLACFEEALVTSVAFAKKNEVPISINLADTNIIQGFRQKFEECIPDIDYVFGTEDEVKTLTNCGSIDEALNSFQPHQTIVATKGAEGSWVKAKEGDIKEFSARFIHPNNVVDTTGAGDFHNAGFIYGILNSKGLDNCIEMANTTSSFVVQQDGADLSDEKWQELKDEVSYI